MSVCLCVCPQYTSSTIATVAFVRSSSYLECRSHNHTLARQCQSVIRTTLKEKPEMRSPAILKRLNRWLPKLAGVYYVPVIYTCAKLHFDLIRGVLPPPPNYAKLPTTCSLGQFFGFFQLATAQAAVPILTIIRQKTPFRARMCLLGVPRTKFYILTLFSAKKQIFGRFSIALRTFRLKTGFNMGASSVNTP